MASNPLIQNDPGTRFRDRLPGRRAPDAQTALREAVEREALLRVAGAVSGANDLEGVLELAAEEALKAIDAASLSISRFEENRTRYRTLINVGNLSGWEERLPEDETYDVARFPGLLEMSRTANPYFSAVDDPDCEAAASEFLRSVGKSSDLGVAIVVEGEIWGGIWATSDERASFEAEDVSFLEAIGGQIATAIARVQLFSRVSRLAYEDPLTGLANRRAFEERLERALRRYAGGESTVALMLCDVDRLKQINDVHGHAGGDRALRSIASALVSAAAPYPGSFVARLGGDEFCLLIESVERIAEGSELTEIEEIAAAAQSELGSLRPQLTLSCGAATATTRTATSTKLLAAADTAQYVAKRRGGNRICTTAQIVDAPNPFTLAPLRGSSPAERIAKAVSRDRSRPARRARARAGARAAGAGGDRAHRGRRPRELRDLHRRPHHRFPSASSRSVTTGTAATAASTWSARGRSTTLQPRRLPRDQADRRGRRRDLRRPRRRRELRPRRAGAARPRGERGRRRRSGRR